MDIIRKWASRSNNVKSQRLPMTKEQLLEMAKNDLFTIGMHTHTHPCLEGMEKKLQVKEILKCKKVLNDVYGIKSNMLAYPYGKYDDCTREAVRDTKIDACFTTEAININNNSNLLCLGRYQVGNWNTSTLKEQIKSWNKVAGA